MTALLRRTGRPLRLAAIRVRRRLRVAALTAAGLAAAAAALAVVLAGSLAAQERSTSRAAGDLPPGERSILAAYAGIPAGTDLQTLDAAARGAIATVTSTPPVRVLQLKTFGVAGLPVQLRAVDGLPRWLRLDAGRLPRRCVPAHCEVVRLAGEARMPPMPGLRLVVVGSGKLVSPLPFGRFGGDDRGPSGEEGAPGRGTAVVVAGDVAAVSALPALSSIYRGYGWVAPLPQHASRPWEIAAVARDLDRARSDLLAAADAFELTSPARELTEAAATARGAGHRLLLVGGLLVALLLALAVLAAASVRRDVDGLRRRLTWAGATRWQVFLAVAGDVALVVSGGVLAGWLAGCALAALVARAAGAPAGAVVRHSCLSWWGLAAAVALAVGAATVLLLALFAPSVRAGRRSLSLLDVAAACMLAVLAVALARGRVTATDLGRDGGAAALLLLLPGLVAFVGAVACARALRPALGWLERSTRGRSATFRSAVLSLVRSPGHAAIATSFLAVALGLTLFAVAYGSTLERGLEDQATYAVPATYVVRERLDAGALVPPLQAAPLSRWQALAPGVAVARVIRRPGSTSEASGGRRAYTLLGVPAETVAALDGWRGDFGDRPLAALATSIAPSPDVGLTGPLLPAGATAVEVPVRVEGGALDLRVGVLNPAGEARQLELRPAGTGVRRASLPPSTRGGRVIGIELTRSLDVESHRKNDAPFVSGTMTLGPLRATGAGVSQVLEGGPASWVGLGRVEVAPRGAGVRVRYLVGNDVVSQLRPRQPFDDAPLPVLASPGLAAIAGEDGVLALRLGPGRIVVRVAGVIDRFPSVDGDVVVADEASLFAVGTSLRPGAVTSTELWLSSPTPLDPALRQPPFSVLDVSSQRARLDELRADPLTRGALIALAGCAVAALLLAVVGFLVLVLSDLRDERGELFSLEAQGAGPAHLRRHVRLRALVVAGAGLIGGLLIGLALAALVAGTVAVTANGLAPEPPLQLELDWPLLAAAVVVYALALGAVVATVTWTSFRSPFPARGTVSEP